MLYKGQLVGKISVLALILLLLSTFIVAVSVPRVSAQTQFVVASPGEINLGMSTSIMVTAPAAGMYTVIVQKPSGAEFTLHETFTSSALSENATFGNASSGFGAIVDQVGTYNVYLEQGTSLL